MSNQLQIWYRGGGWTLLRREYKTTINGRSLGHVTQFRNFGTPNNFWTKWALRFKFGTVLVSLRTDHKTTHKWAWPGSRDLIYEFWDPVNNFWTNWSICFKFGIEMEDGPLLRREYKTTSKWAWPGSRDPISKFVTLYNFWTNWAIRFKFGTEMEDGPFLRTNHKMTR